MACLLTYPANARALDSWNLDAINYVFDDHWQLYMDGRLFNIHHDREELRDMTTVLGIDIGTQSVKVVFYDFEAGRIASIGSAPLDLCQTDDGAAEQRAEWWIEALQKATASVDKSVRVRVVAIGVSGQQHGFVPIDRSGEVQIPVKLWCDTSTGAECDRIIEAFGGCEVCIAEVGNLILP